MAIHNSEPGKIKQAGHYLWRDGTLLEWPFMSTWIKPKISFLSCFWFSAPGTLLNDNYVCRFVRKHEVVSGEDVDQTTPGPYL